MIPLCMKNNSFGLDISERAFRLVQLKKINKKIKLVSFSYQAVPKGVLKEGKIVDSKKAEVIIDKLINNVTGQKLISKVTNVCLPEQKTFIKLINLDYPEGKNILEVLTNSDLVPCSLEIEAVTLARSIFSFKEKLTEPVMVLDLGARRTGLFIYAHNVIPFTISLSFSSDGLTEIIRKQLKITSKEAEKVKRSLGLNSSKAEGYSEKLIAPEIKKIAKKIREANYFYQEHFKTQKSIKKLYLTGGGSQMPNLDTFLTKETKMKVHLTNPLTNVSLDKVKLPENQVASYATAIGLALRNLNT